MLSNGFVEFFVKWYHFSVRVKFCVFHTVCKSRDLWFDNGRGPIVYTWEISVGVSAKKMDVIGAIFSFCTSPTVIKCWKKLQKNWYTAIQHILCEINYLWVPNLNWLFLRLFLGSVFLVFFFQIWPQCRKVYCPPVNLFLSEPKPNTEWSNSW